MHQEWKTTLQEIARAESSLCKAVEIYISCLERSLDAGSENLFFDWLAWMAVEVE